MNLLASVWYTVLYLENLKLGFLACSRCTMGAVTPKLEVQTWKFYARIGAVFQMGIPGYVGSRPWDAWGFVKAGYTVITYS